MKQAQRGALEGVGDEQDPKRLAINSPKRLANHVRLAEKMLHRHNRIVTDDIRIRTHVNSRHDS